MDRKPYEDRFNGLAAEAQLWIPAWKDIQKFELPLNGKFPGDLPNAGKKIDHSEVLDGEPAKAIRTTAAGFAAHLTSPAQPWMALTLRNKDLARFPRVRWWLDVTCDIVLSVFNDSGTYDYLASMYEEFVGFNTCAGITEEDRLTAIRNLCFTIGEYFLGVGADRRVDTFGREYDVTVGQLVDSFGSDNVKPDTAKLYTDGKKDQWIKCRHMIAPNRDRLTGKMDNKNMPFISLYWEPGMVDGKVLRHGGYLEFPIQAGRWKVTSSNTYGKGPGWEILGDAKMLQKAQRERFIAIEKVNDPPMQGPADAEIETIPGGFTPTSSDVQDGSVKPAYQIRPDLNAIKDLINDTKASIREGVFADRFLMLESIERGMTAREVYERTMENMRAVGPVVVKIQNEILDPLIRRTFNILLRAGMLPPLPPELQGQEINIEYVSLMAQAQKSARTQGIQEHLLAVGEMAKINGAVTDVINWDKAARLDGELRGVPAGIDNSEEETAAIRQDRAKQQAAAAQVEATQRAVDAAHKLGKTPLGGGTALDKVAQAAGVNVDEAE